MGPAPNRSPVRRLAGALRLHAIGGIRPVTDPRLRRAWPQGLLTCLRKVELLPHAARSRSSRRNHMTSWFQLAHVWSTNLRSSRPRGGCPPQRRRREGGPLTRPMRATVGRPSFARQRWAADVRQVTSVGAHAPRKYSSSHFRSPFAAIAISPRLFVGVSFTHRV